MKRHWKVLAGLVFASGLAIGGGVGPASAATVNQRVIESTLKDGSRPNGDASDTSWYREDTRVGGGITLSRDYGGPSGFGDGAVVLTTNDKSTAKAQLYTNQVNGTLLADITSLSYSTYQDGSQLGFAQGAVAYQLQVDLNGPNVTGGFTTLTYEPYLNPQVQGVLPDQWQFWDATAGNWYTSRDINCGTLVIPRSSGAPPFTNPTEVGQNCIGATVLGLGLNIGSSNPSYITAADGVHIATITDSFTADFGPK